MPTEFTPCLVGSPQFQTAVGERKKSGCDIRQKKTQIGGYKSQKGDYDDPEESDDEAFLY
jgi:hypothetical protein